MAAVAVSNHGANPAHAVAFSNRMSRNHGNSWESGIGWYESKTPRRFYCAGECTGASENKVADSEDEMAKGERAGKSECDPVLSISGIKDECGTWKDGHTKDYRHDLGCALLLDPMDEHFHI